MLALAGHDYQTLAESTLHFTIAVPYGEDGFELGIFDGETGGRWDNSQGGLIYELYYDPFQLDNDAPADRIGRWQGNATEPTSGPQWTSSGPLMPDNGWWTLSVVVPDPAVDPTQSPAPGESPSGTFFYHLKVLADDFQLDPSTVSNFKLRVASPARLLSRNFAFEAALHGNLDDVETIYPGFDPAAPPPVGATTFWIDEALAGRTTYDGTWTFELHVPYSQRALEIWDGDFDHGTDARWPDCYPAMIPMTWSCADDDDADTGVGEIPPFVEIDPATGQPTDGCVSERAATYGVPADDSMFDLYRRGWCDGSPGICQLTTQGCVRYLLRSPGADGVQGTGDEVEFLNSNPSSQREWERFRISTRHPTVFDPGRPAAEQADYVVDDATLPGGVWQVEIEGVDLSNLNAWWTSFSQFRGYMVGDTVWHDRDGDGRQDRNEPGISGVALELRDENGQLSRIRLAGDPGSYDGSGWPACAARNTGGNTLQGRAVDDLGLYCFEVGVLNHSLDGPDTAGYAVRVAATELAPGGALYDFFGAVPLATTPSPEQLGTIVEGDGPLMSFDFGYFCPASEGCGCGCEGKVSELTLRYLGASEALVEVVQRRGGVTVFSGPVPPDGQLSFVGADRKGTLGSEIRVFVDGSLDAVIHTSCSQPIGPGLVFGDFEVVRGRSRVGGELCPLGDPDGPGCIHRCVWPD